MATFRSSVRVRFAELDPYAHVNHAVYVTYFEVGRVEALMAANLDLARLADEGISVIVSELAVRYRRPAVANDELTVETSITEIRGASSSWHQRILRGEELLCTADVRAAVCNANGSPIRMPPVLRERLSVLLAEPASK